MDLPVQHAGQPAAAKVGRKAETCRLLTNLSLVEFNLGNHESSFYFSALAVGLGHNRFKALFRLAKALKALECEEEATGLSARCCDGSSQFGAGLSKKEKDVMAKEFGPFDTTAGQNIGFSVWADNRALEWMRKAQSELGDREAIL